MRLLFIIKKKQSYGSTSQPSGLANNTIFTTDYLSHHRHDVVAKTVYVDDNNDIDREVTAFKPQFVFIEALWVVPDKFHILQELHPTVKWVVRIHSKIPFLSIEGMAIDWMNQMTNKELYPNVIISANNKLTSQELRSLGYPNTYLPNMYTNVHGIGL